MHNQPTGHNDFDVRVGALCLVLFPDPLLTNNTSLCRIGRMPEGFKPTGTEYEILSQRLLEALGQQAMVETVELTHLKGFPRN